MGDLNLSAEDLLVLRELKERCLAGEHPLICAQETKLALEGWKPACLEEARSWQRIRKLTEKIIASAS